MTLAGNQPYFLPYLGFWQLIHLSDLFLLADDYDFIRHSWINRNRILVNGQVQYFRVEIARGGPSRLIRDKQVALTPYLCRDKLKTVAMAYHKAPYLAEGYALAERILTCPERNLALFLEYSIREVCAYLGITTPIKHSSDLTGNSCFKREERIYDFCHRLGADTYVNLPGGQALYDREEFARRGIRLCFIQPELKPYPQSGGPFVERLSILDAIMFNSREQLHEMLDDYTFIDG